ncbi:Alpha-ketoglutarate-dependent dioxygenase abh1 [Trichoderma ghanense]|uniref:Alpha-ketoglutarate-dependent dioxygenase abh1 n=1 Tax=Trichoderma ghanense TaxID=65468 RepID=A0ABY2H6H5_9HYPO
MVPGALDLDAHEQPSDQMKAEWKHFARLDQTTLLRDTPLDDPRLPLEETEFRLSGHIPRAQIAEAFSHLGAEYVDEGKEDGDAPILHHPLLPGLLIIPSLIPPAVQTHLLNTMIHRDLSNPTHQTNLHLHYNLPYPSSSPSSSSPSPSSPSSFFSLPPSSPPTFTPKDPSIHNALSISQVLHRRLHWVTLGGQYDWTNRVYPDAAPPQFPADLAGFLKALFPETLAQAAIVNFYTPGDTMMMHRDVSEEVDKGLVSLSFGCDCLFMIAPSPGPGQHTDTGNNDEANEGEDEGGKGEKKKYLLLRLRSGDAIYMTQESRYAWHGVPKVMKGTCPEYLADWPAGREDGEYEEWKGWMQNKRINLNVRQMR